jgi:Zn-dependent peptidase ImmA (M78 family)
VKTYRSFKSESKKREIQKFIDFLGQELSLTQLPTVNIVDDPEFSKEMKTFGCFNLQNDTITVQIHQRHPLDVYRTLAHEFVHYLQKINGMELNGEDGSDCENEANSRAAVILRKYTKRIDNHGY